MKIFSFFNRRLLIIELTKLTEQQRPNLMLPTLLEKQHDHTLLGFFATSHVHNRLVLCCIPARSSAPSKNNKGYHQELKFNLWWILPWDEFAIVITTKSHPRVQMKASGKIKLSQGWNSTFHVSCIIPRSKNSQAYMWMHPYIHSNMHAYMLVKHPKWILCDNSSRLFAKKFYFRCFTWFWKRLWRPKKTNRE